MEAHILPVFQAAFDLFMDHLNATLAAMSEDPAPFHTHGAQWGGSGRFVLERLDVADGSKYCRLLEALASLIANKSAPTALNAVLEGLVLWRTEHLQRDDEQHGGMLASAIDVLFCTAILRLLASPYCIGGLLISV
jgi:hypothetical protein